MRDRTQGMLSLQWMLRPWHTHDKCGSINATSLANADPGCKRVTSGGWARRCTLNSRLNVSHLTKWAPHAWVVLVFNRTASFEEMPQNALPRVLPKTQPFFSLVPFFVAREPTRAKTPTSKVVTGECSGQERAKSHPWPMPVPSVVSALPQILSRSLCNRQMVDYLSTSGTAHGSRFLFHSEDLHDEGDRDKLLEDNLQNHH